MKICVIGNGIMGGGIVQIVAQSGFEVIWIGRAKESLGRAQERLNKNLDRLVDRERIDKTEKDAII